MKKYILNTKLFEKARALEQNDEPGQAIEIYQKLYNQLPADRRVIGRMLIIFRKLKAYKKELQLIDNTIKQTKESILANQRNWMKTHRKIASINVALGRSLKMLDAKGLPLYEEPFITGLKKRKALVKRRLKLV
jgi:hypothetical protein